MGNKVCGIVWCNAPRGGGGTVRGGGRGGGKGATFIKQRGGRVAPDERSTSLVCPKLTFHSSFFSSSLLYLLYLFSKGKH